MFPLWLTVIGDRLKSQSAMMAEVKVPLSLKDDKEAATHPVNASDEPDAVIALVLVFDTYNVGDESVTSSNHELETCTYPPVPVMVVPALGLEASVLWESTRIIEADAPPEIGPNTSFPINFTEPVT